MTMIRRYGELPALFVPDVGEVVRASQSPAGPFTRAVVIAVRRTAGTAIRVGVEWLEDASASSKGTPVRKGTKGSIYISSDDAVPLIRRVPVKRD